MLSTDVQLTAADPEQGTVGQLLAVQFYLNEVILPPMGILDTHFQHQLWNKEGREEVCLMVA